MSRDRLLEELEAVVGRSHLLTDPDVVAGYVTDWTGRWRGETRAVVRPGSTEEVSRVVAVCAAHRVPLVPQGGNTGLVGGSIPHRGELVLSLRRLDRLHPVDSPTGEVVVGAGATLAAVQQHARRAGLDYGVDLAARHSATVGGTVATNAGGTRVVVHGDTGRQVVGLEAVLADGGVISSLGRTRKKSTGPDPLRLLVGSEGTLGVITAARLRLVPPLPTGRLVTLVGVDGLGEGLDWLGPGITALEFLDRACLDAVARHRRLVHPLTGDSPYYLLIESDHPPLLPDESEAVVDPRLWVFREAITETLNALGVPVKLDVAVPRERVDDLASRLRGLDLGGDLYLFGHLAEGNFHVNVVDPPHPERVEDLVLGVVTELGGTIASEHGIGVAKTVWWRRSTPQEMLRAQLALKEALDPNRLLNPEVLWGRR